MEQKECTDCKVIKPLNEYRKYRKDTDRENSYAKTCKQCLNERDKIRKKNLRQKKI